MVKVIQAFLLSLALSCMAAPRGFHGEFKSANREKIVSALGSKPYQKIRSFLSSEAALIRKRNYVEGCLDWLSKSSARSLILEELSDAFESRGFLGFLVIERLSFSSSVDYFLLCAMGDEKGVDLIICRPKFHREDRFAHEEWSLCRIPAGTLAGEKEKAVVEICKELAKWGKVGPLVREPEGYEMTHSSVFFISGFGWWPKSEFECCSVDPNTEWVILERDENMEPEEREELRGIWGDPDPIGRMLGQLSKTLGIEI